MSDLPDITSQPPGPVARLAALPDLTSEEVDALVRGYSDERLAENYRHAAKHPGTDWHRRLSAEIGRRDALGPAR